MLVAYHLDKNYRNKTKIDPTTAIIISKTFTDFKYFFVSGLTVFLENAPAPKEITIKKINTNTSITRRNANLSIIFL